MPAVYDTKKIDIGVYAGDSLSTSRCRINCKPSILDGEGVEHQDPPADVYNEIVAICNEAVTAAEEAETAAEGFEATTRESFANAVKGNLFGAAVRADDVSPVEHTVNVKVESKNLYNDLLNYTADPNTTYTYANDILTVAGQYVNKFITLADGETYTFSCKSARTGNSGGGVHIRAYTDDEKVYSTLYSASSTLSPKVTVTMPKGYPKIRITFYGDNSTFTEIMLERGGDATGFVPYADPTTATVKRCGKNLIPYPYQNKTKTENGISYQDNGDGSITASGLSDKQSNFVFTANNFNIKKNVNYTLSLKGNFQVDDYLILYIHSSEENKTMASLMTTVAKSLTFKADKDCTTAAIYVVIPQGRTISGTFAPQLEIGTTETEYEQYKIPQSATANADGTVEGITSLSPTMTLLTDTAGTVINCEYNRDTNKALTGNIVTAEGTVVSQNADFAEVAEWWDGNPDNEDRTGYFVCADVPVHGIVMKKATSIDDVKGVSILAPAFAGNYTKDKLDSSGNLLPQYSYVAIIGFVPVIDNGTCEVGGRCMPDDNGCAIPSSNNMGYQVVNRIDENRVLIIIEPNGDMVQRIKTQVGEIETALDVIIEIQNTLIGGDSE